MITPWNTIKIDFDEPSHKYTVLGKNKPSVGQIMRLVGIGKDFDSMPDSQKANIERAGAKGKAIHRWTEIIDKGEYDNYDPPQSELIPYLNAWRLFKNELKVEIIEIEGIHYSEYGDYCGTLDRIVSINGVLYLLDIKTAKNIDKNARLQTMGYTYFFKEELKRMILQPKEDGSYQIYDDGKYGKKWLDDHIDKKKWEAVLEISSWIRNKQ